MVQLFSCRRRAFRVAEVRRTGGVPMAGVVTPAHGSTSGGIAVTVTGFGFGFTKVSKVLFGNVAGINATSAFTFN